MPGGGHGGEGQAGGAPPGLTAQRGGRGQAMTGGKLPMTAGHGYGGGVTGGRSLDPPLLGNGGGGGGHCRGAGDRKSVV